MENTDWPLIKREKSLKEKSYHVIKEMILTGKLDNNVIHNEKTFSDLLGVSRTPVREAMLELGKENIVSYIPGKGLKINIFTKNVIRDAYEIRKLVEGLIINKICNNIDKKDLKKIEILLKKQINYYEKIDEISFIEIDKEFHLYLSSLQDNDQIKSILLNLRDQQHLMGIEAVKNNKKRMLQVIDEHMAIFSALKKGDQKKSYNLMMQHLSNTEAILLSHL